MSQTIRPLNECIKLPQGLDKALAKTMVAFSCISGTALAALVAGSYAGLGHKREDRLAKLQQLLFPSTTAGAEKDAKRALSPLTANERLRGAILRYLSLTGGAIGFASSITLLQILLYKTLSKQGSIKHLMAGKAALRAVTLFTSTIGLASLLRYLLQKPLALLLGKSAWEAISVGVQQGDKKVSYELCTPLGALSTLAAAGVAMYEHRTRQWWLKNILAFGSAFEAIAKSDDRYFASTMLILALLGLNDVFMVNYSHRFFHNNVMETLARELDYATIKFPLDSMRKPVAFAMLGLGDIVIPGAFVSLALKLDRAISRQVAQDKSYNFPAYFAASLLGYTAGLVGYVAAAFSYRFSAHESTGSGKAQPALAYLVPATALPVLGLVWYKGDFERMFEYDASKDFSVQEDQNEDTESI